MQYAADISRGIDCPVDTIKHILGEGGETVEGLSRTYGAKIVIDETQDPMPITIAGQAIAVDNAAAAVKKIMDGWRY